MKKIALLFIACLVVYFFWQQVPTFFSDDESSIPEISAQDLIIESAFENRQSDIQVSGSGNILKILPDDTQGSRHQKFIVGLNSGQTLLISHNIDIAPRINDLKAGDPIVFYGEYEWNDKGGVVHWTHDDPTGRHEDGWLKYEGKIYQ